MLSAEKFYGKKYILKLFYAYLKIYLQILSYSI